MAKENMSSGRIKTAVYRNYFRAGGNYLFIILVFLAFIGAQAAANGADYFISYWVNLEQQAETKENEELDREFIIYIYSAITSATIIMALTHSIFYFIFFTRASVKLHDTIFAKISQATMRFFNLNPTGRILNRFSKDMGSIDEYIPFIISDVLEIILLIAGTIILTSLVDPWLLLPSAGLLFFFYLLRLIYLETSRSVKRLEGITHSPILNHITASIQGLSTIRAFSAEKDLILEFDSHQNLHSSAQYLFISASRAFGLWMDLICTIFVSLILISFLVFDKDYYGGDVGLIITQYLGLTIVVQWGIRQWSELENSMTSVERVLEYTTIETESVRKPISSIPRAWPEFGGINFQNVSMKYNPNDPLILKNLNFNILPQEKIGIVGRTGAGKTSIIAALFQLYDVEGSIIIDNVDITKLPLEESRPKISIIPQEPVLFSGSIRKNLDPFEEYSDDILWDALEQVELKHTVAEIPAGLNAAVSESGSNFSIGEKQLICLGRAIVRNNRILVMDEATANVDPYTDSLIQKTIRKKFAGCTVITIAHRLHTVMDSDRIMVVEAGEIVEFDRPYNLLQKTDGLFYTMVQTTGETVAENLNTIAKENHLKQKVT
ncbi:hypothetical protein ILUMI_24862 [Ignelater luminosus]|uniref:Uncharacterized protein n=1 Tax=Ignelater luminosus TaxID=2038154 RepID=A0A8K0C9P1_IGNLU|nr:hypothetical protein ILUMI_24862 [Ignelater luminosus]